MLRKSVLSLCLLLASAATVVAQEEEPRQTADPEAKLISGMSVLGNQEAPMSLFIVPWKSSELGVETNLSRTLNERDVPVDRDVFMRELAFHKVTDSHPSAASPGMERLALK